MITITAESIDGLKCSEEDYLFDNLSGNLWYFYRFLKGDKDLQQWQRVGQAGHPRDTSSQWMLEAIEKLQPEFRVETYPEYRIRKVYEHREQQRKEQI